MPILPMIKRQALHATLLEAPHPETGQVLKFQSPLPDDIGSVIAI